MPAWGFVLVKYAKIFRLFESASGIRFVKPTLAFRCAWSAMAFGLVEPAAFRLIEATIAFRLVEVAKVFRLIEYTVPFQLPLSCLVYPFPDNG